ncbi:hypothetical protein ACHQM5_010770 [Ranunculus cassubicifolius]
MAATRETMFALVLSFMLFMGCSVSPAMSQGQCYSECGTELFMCLSMCLGDAAGDGAQATACGEQCNLYGMNCAAQCDQPPTLPQPPNSMHF